MKKIKRYKHDGKRKVSTKCPSDDATVVIWHQSKSILYDYVIAIIL